MSIVLMAGGHGGALGGPGESSAQGQAHMLEGSRDGGAGA